MRKFIVYIYTVYMTFTQVLCLSKMNVVIDLIWSSDFSIDFPLDQTKSQKDLIALL